MVHTCRHRSGLHVPVMGFHININPQVAHLESLHLHLHVYYVSLFAYTIISTDHIVT